MPRLWRVLRRRSSPYRSPHGLSSLATIAMLVVACPPSGAQAPADRAALEQRLVAIAAVAPSSASNDIPAIAAALDLASARTGNPTTRQLQVAMDRLDGLAARWTDWPWPRIAQAMVVKRLAQDGAHLLPFGGMHEGESFAQAHFRFLLDAVERDPEYPFAHSLAARSLEVLGERHLLGSERNLLERLLRSRSTNPLVSVVQARQLRASGQRAEALLELQAAVERGVDTGLAQLELARTLRGLGRRLEAREAYFAGLRHASSLSRDAYRHDLARVVHPDSLAGFADAPDDDLHDWVVAFWARRDAEAANLPGERLDEHLSRWVVAHSVFKLHNPWRRTQYDRVEQQFEGLAVNCIGTDPAFFEELWELEPSRRDDVRWDELLLDHRGVTLIRHGRPFARIAHARRPLGGGDRGSMASRVFREGLEIGDDHEATERFFSNTRYESWLMRIDDRWRFLHFQPSGALGDYAATTLATFLPADHWDYEALSNVMEDYREAARRLSSRTIPTYELVNGLWKITDAPGNCLGPVLPLIRQDRVNAHHAVARDTDTPRIIEDLDASIGMFGISNTGGPGAGEVVAVVAIPPGNLDELVKRSAELPVRLSRYSEGGGLHVLDTVLSLDRVVGTDAFGLLRVPSRQGAHTVGILVKSAAEGRGSYRVRTEVPVLGGEEFDLADLLLGRPDLPGSVSFASSAFPLSPYGIWPGSLPLMIGFQVRGVPVAEEFVLEVTVQPQGRGARGRDIRVRSRQQSTGPVSEHVVQLGLERLESGVYDVAVAVEYGGKRASRIRTIGVDGSNRR